MNREAERVAQAPACGFPPARASVREKDPKQSDPESEDRNPQIAHRTRAAKLPA
jgi:hypothetical protein